MAADNLREQQARTIKASAYVSVLRQHKATALEAAQLPEEGWEAIRQLCGEPYATRPLASPATRAVAVAMLEAAEAEALRCGPDPWAGMA